MYRQIKGSILIISHQERILNIADRIVVVADGEIVNAGTKEEVMPKLVKHDMACKTLLEKL